ncbi:MAG TPA: LysE family transporter [Candidatus Babeliales bacterium]|nr:LysE family transporter [Candidatus Babeliales bacterium]
MDLSFFIKGIIIGAAIAFPVGPIGILCLRRLLIQGPLMGIASGFGAATADVVFAVAALLSLGFLSAHLTQFAFAIRLVSSILLSILGIVILSSKPPQAMQSKSPLNILESYITTFFLTLANPIIILTLIFLFAAVGIDHELDRTSELILTASGVFIGSTLWWIVLGILAAYFQPKIKASTFRRINQFSGIGIMSFGILSLIKLILK